ncbi:MAG: hypothetical protein ACI8VJ_000043 [Polaribacter sp.]
MLSKLKRGSKNGKRWSIEYKAGFSADQINVEWDKQDTYGQEFGGIAHFTGSGLPNTGFSYGDKIADRIVGADTVDTSGAYFQADGGNSYYPITSKNSRETFNQINRDPLFKTCITQENNVSFTYNGEDSRTFVTLSNWDQHGIYNGASDYRRTSLRLNNNTDFSGKFTLKLSTTYVNIESNRVQQGRI